MARHRHCDEAIGDLFAVPQPAAAVPGSMDYRTTVAGLLGAMLDSAAHRGVDRYQVSATASRLAGRDVSKAMLDAYTSTAREAYNCPAWLLPLIEVACVSHAFTAWLAEIRGGRLMIGEDALAAELGRIQRERDALAERERRLRAMLRRGS